MMEQGYDEADEAFQLRRIADTLDDLLGLYRSHVRLTAKTAKLSLGPPLRDLGPDEPVVSGILAILEELERS